MNEILIPAPEQRIITLLFELISSIAVLDYNTQKSGCLFF
jgi:hypothetical protein